MIDLATQQVVNTTQIDDHELRILTIETPGALGAECQNSIKTAMDIGMNLYRNGLRTSGTISCSTIGGDKEFKLDYDEGLISVGAIGVSVSAFANPAAEFYTFGDPIITLSQDVRNACAEYARDGMIANGLFSAASCSF